MKKQTGKSVNLLTKKAAPTPFLPEDQKIAPSGRPLADSKVCACPYCMHTFLVRTKDEGPPALISSGRESLDPNADDFPMGSPICDGPEDIPVLRSNNLKKRAIDPKDWYLKMHYTKDELGGSCYSHGLHSDDEANTEALSSDAGALSELDGIGSVDGQPSGELNRIAASILMRILYAARMVRFDLLRVTCRIATRHSRWTEMDDRRVHRPIRYIYHHAGDRQVGFIGNDVHDTSLRLFCDADFAGDAASQRSTSGVHLAIHGSHSIFPLQGLSAKQDAVAFSTPEAEFYAGCLGYRKVMVPALQLWDVLGPHTQVPMMHEDIQRFSSSSSSGRNPTMRHLGRVHRVSVQWLHERLGRPPDKDPTLLFYEDARNMSADICTKGFSAPDLWGRALRLINVFRPDALNSAFLSVWVSERNELGRAPS